MTDPTLTPEIYGPDHAHTQGLGTAILALFAVAMWALKPRLIYATITSVLVLSLAVIWAVSAANGM